MRLKKLKVTLPSRGRGGGDIQRIGFVLIKVSVKFSSWITYLVDHFSKSFKSIKTLLKNTTFYQN